VVPVTGGVASLKQLVDGERFTWLGENVRLALVDEPAHPAVVLDPAARELRLRSNHATRETIIDGYRDHGLDHATRLVQTWAAHASLPACPVDVLDLGPRELADRRGGAFRVHWAAFQLPEPVLEHLVVAELLDAASSRAPGRTLVQLLDQHLLGWRVKQSRLIDERRALWRGGVDGTLVAAIAGITQPVSEPKLRSEYLELVSTGRLVDHAGRPLTLHECTWCGDFIVSGDTCPVTVPCPLSTCGAPAGTRHRRRPSGHEASKLHAARVRAAEQLVDARLAAGDSYVPAPWPGPRLPPVGEQGDLFSLGVAS
jgi:hypothetical protein